MALPIVIPAIAEGAAALSAALGLTAIATKNDQNFGNINLNGIRTASGLNIAPLVISTETLFNKATSPTKVHVPSADNALVLRPEYRTVTTPVEYIGYKPFWQDDELPPLPDDVIILEAEAQGPGADVSNPPAPKPENDPKQDNKEDNKNELPTNDKSQSAIKRGWNKQGLPKIENPTWSQQWSRVGQNIAYGVGRSARFVSSPGFVLPVATVGGTTLGGYWALRDNNADKANQIDTVATRKNNTPRFRVVEIVE